MTLIEMKERLRQAYPNAQIEVIDLTGGQDHWEVSIIDTQFQQMTRIQQHQHVMAQFKEELATGEVHALSIKTKVK